MSVDFSRHTVGDTVQVHCCDECARAHGVEPRTPPDSGVESWPCEVCGHYGIGSLMTCKIDEWLRLQPNARHPCKGIVRWDGQGDGERMMTTDETRRAFERWITLETAHPITRIEQRGYSWDGDYATASVDSMWRAWQAAAAAERERCAKICDEIATDRDDLADYATAVRCATAIRGDA